MEVQNNSRIVNIYDDGFIAEIDNRMPIFFDINVWIDLCDRETNLTTRIKTKLKQLVKNGQIFCPLYYVVLWELTKQARDSALRVGNLMEELSLNVCFSHKATVFTREVEHWLYSIIEDKRCTLQYNDIFVPIMAHYVSQAEFSPGDWPLGVAEDYLKAYQKKISHFTITDYINMQSPLPDWSDEPAPYYNKIAQTRFNYTKGNETKVSQIEAKNIFTAYIHPVMKNVFSQYSPDQVIIQKQEKFMEYLESLSGNEATGCFKALLPHTPALRNEFEICSILGRDLNMKYRLNHIIDRELLPVPFAYANVFVARDKWIRELIKQANLMTINQTQYFYDLSEFEEYLMETFK